MPNDAAAVLFVPALVAGLYVNIAGWDRASARVAPLGEIYERVMEIGEKHSDTILSLKFWFFRVVVRYAVFLGVLAATIPIVIAALFILLVRKPLAWLLDTWVGRFFLFRWIIVSFLWLFTLAMHTAAFWFFGMAVIGAFSQSPHF